MSFRYKSALVSLLSFLIAYGWYFAKLAMHPDSHGAAQMAWLVSAIVIVVVIEVIGHIAIAATSADSYASMDERERSFDRRATNIGYYLLILGALASAASIHLGAGRSDMANFILLAVVVAEATRQAIFLILHHRAA